MHNLKTAFLTDKSDFLQEKAAFWQKKKPPQL